MVRRMFIAKSLSIPLFLKMLTGGAIIFKMIVSVFKAFSHKNKINNHLLFILHLK
jgi:archaellum biogenesis protein FlaJ (TadC family)